MVAFGKTFLACRSLSSSNFLLSDIGPVGEGELSPRGTNQDHARVGRRGQGPHLRPVRKKDGREEGILDGRCVRCVNLELTGTEMVVEMMDLPSTYFTRPTIQVSRLEAYRG